MLRNELQQLTVLYKNPSCTQYRGSFWSDISDRCGSPFSPMQPDQALVNMLSQQLGYPVAVDMRVIPEQHYSIPAP